VASRHCGLPVAAAGANMKNRTRFVLITLAGLIVVAALAVLGLPSGAVRREVVVSARLQEVALDLQGRCGIHTSDDEGVATRPPDLAGRSSKDEARDLFLDVPEEDLAGDLARELFDEWASNHPTQAFNWAMAHSAETWGRSLVDVAIIRWAESDPVNALAWARKLPLGEFREASLAAVGHEAVRNHPLLAIDAASEVADPAVQDALVCRALGEWAARDPDEALRWAVDVTEPDFRQLTVASAAIASAERDPLGAALLVRKSMSPGAEQDRAITSVVLRWVQKDPMAAAAWVESFPDAPLRRDAVDALVNQWANNDPRAAGNWLEDLAEGDFRDVAIRAYARTVEQTDRSLADRWMQRVSRRP